MKKTQLHPALADLLRPVEPAESGIQMRGIGNWSCPRLGLYGYSTLQKLKNAIRKKNTK